jgi:hypothetical protein
MTLAVLYVCSEVGTDHSVLSSPPPGRDELGVNHSKDCSACKTMELVRQPFGDEMAKGVKAIVDAGRPNATPPLHLR